MARDFKPLAPTTSEEIRALRRRVSELEDELERERDGARPISESEDRYRTIFDCANDAIFVQSFDISGSFGNFLDVNDVACERLQYSRAELCSMSNVEIDAPDLEIDFPELFSSLVSNGKATFETIHIAKDGTRIPVEISTRILELGGETLAMSIARDISDRKLAMEALRESEARYRAVVEAFEGLIYICSDDYRVEFMNQRFIERTGYDGTGHLCYKALHDLDEVCPWCVNERVLKGETVRWEVLSPKDGRWFYVVNTPIHHADGSVSKQAMILDVTERKKGEEEKRLLETKMLQAQKLESLGVLAGGIAHDFNNILMAILGNADLALSKLPPAVPVRTHLEDIETASRRAAELCRQMLAYSGKGRFVIGPLNLSDTVKEMASMVKVSISSKVELWCQLADDLPNIRADATQIRQVIMNLLTNASEAIGEGRGVVALRTALVCRDSMEMQDALLDARIEADEYVVLEVEDTGCGMEESTRERIFEPFFTTKFQGRGLGMSAILGIVRGHEGDIIVDSEPGEGTTITVVCPASRVEEGRSKTIVKGSPLGALEGLKVLVVDDEVSVRDVSRQMLTKHGVEVFEAADGGEALDLLQDDAHDVDCVILDLTMPNMTGEECFEAISKIRPNVPVLLSSGYGEREATRRFVGLAIAGFIQKPYTATTLIRKIRSTLKLERGI